MKLGHVLLMRKLEEVGVDPVISALLTSGQKANLRGIRKATRIMWNMTKRDIKKKGLKGALTTPSGALVHASRHPLAVRAIKAGSYGGPEATTWPMPHHQLYLG